MKKLSFLFVALAFVGFITLSSCKSTTQPAEEATEEVTEQPAEEPAPAAVDTTAAAEDMGGEDMSE